jgi:3-ketosteroid 9alpha-monooxygenase subunit B
VSGTVEVELDGERRTLDWPDGERLLDVLTGAGMAAPSSCREGQCGACTTRVEEGEVRMVANAVLDAEDLAEGYVLACQSLRVSDTVSVTYD